MNDTVKLSEEQARMIAAAILPDIRAYVDANRERYEEFLKQWNEKYPQGKEAGQ